MTTKIFLTVLHSVGPCALCCFFFLLRSFACVLNTKWNMEKFFSYVEEEHQQQQLGCMVAHVHKRALNTQLCTNLGCARRARMHTIRWGENERKMDIDFLLILWCFFPLHPGSALVAILWNACMCVYNVVSIYHQFKHTFKARSIYDFLTTNDVKMIEDKEIYSLKGFMVYGLWFYFRTHSQRNYVTFLSCQP